MKLEFETELDCPVEQAFQLCTSREGFLAHFPYKTDWISGADVWEKPGESLKFVFKMNGLPVNYEAEIIEFDKNKRFVDVMRKGPYKFFRHEHHFEARGNKTLYRDVLEFSLGFTGIADKLIAGPMTSRTFRQRHKLLAEYIQTLKQTG